MTSVGLTDGQNDVPALSMTQTATAFVRKCERKRKLEIVDQVSEQQNNFTSFSISK
jgi:hypothetical protein